MFLANRAWLVPGLALSLAAIGVAALAAGLVPAATAARASLQQALQNGGRALVERRSGLARRLLVGAQLSRGRHGPRERPGCGLCPRL